MPLWAACITCMLLRSKWYASMSGKNSAQDAHYSKRTDWISVFGLLICIAIQFDSVYATKILQLSIQPCTRAVSLSSSDCEVTSLQMLQKCVLIAKKPDQTISEIYTLWPWISILCFVWSNGVTVRLFNWPSIYVEKSRCRHPHEQKALFGSWDYIDNAT